MKKALLIIDVQNDYFPGGHCELAGPEAALEKIRGTLSAFREAGLPVIHVQHINTRAGATFFLPDTRGAEIHPDLTPLPDEHLILKHAPNSFYETGLADLLDREGITELVVCGMMTHMCIDTTVRAAKDYSLPVTLLCDACATRDLTLNDRTIPAAAVQDAFMAALNGMFATVVNAAGYTI